MQSREVQTYSGKELRRTVLRNSASGVAQQFVRVALLFAAVPLFIANLGPERYGIFSLLSVVGNLNSFVGFGLNTALTKYVAEQGKSLESDRDIAVTVILQVVVLVPVAVLVIFFEHFIIVSVLGVPANWYPESSFLFVAVVIATAIILVGQSLAGVLDALQRVDIKNYTQLFYNLSYWGLILLAVLVRPSLSRVGLAILVSAALWFVVTCYFVVTRYGSLHLAGLGGAFKRVAKKQVGYGVKVYTGGLIGFFYEPFSKILLSHFVGVTDVGFFDIAVRLRDILRGFVSQIFYPLFPLMSQETDTRKVRLYVHDVEQKAFFLVLPIIVTVIFTLPSFIDIWLRQDTAIIALTAVYIVSFHLVGSSTVIPNYQFLLAKNLPQKTIFLQASNVLFNTVIFLGTVSFFGYYALIIGNVSAIMASFALSLYYQHKYLGSLIFDNWGQLIKTLVLFGIDFIAAGCASSLVPNNLLRIFIIPVVVLLTSVFVFRRTKLINLADIDRYFGHEGKVRQLMLKVLVD